MMTEPQPLLYLARHGQTPANIPGEERLRGLGDYPLTPVGVRQIKELGRQLRKLGVQRVATDDTLRARQSADYVARALDTVALHDPGLRPWDIGSFEGQPEATHRPRLMEYVRNPHRAPPNGMPYVQFFSAWRDAFWHYLSRVRETRQPWVLIVHSGHFATLDDVLLERGSTPTADYDPTPGEVFVVNALAPFEARRL